MRDLTITIVSYHNEEDVKKAVASIETYTPEHIEKQIYLVDNTGKKENSALAEVAGQYKDMTYVATGKNLGFGEMSRTPKAK